MVGCVEGMFWTLYQNLWYMICGQMPKAKGEIKKWQGVQTQDKWIFPWELTQVFA